jgi:colanic acid/amylovoran biosynthesis protein
MYRTYERNGDLALDDCTRTRIGLIGASFETGNMGVGALAAGAIRCIYTQWPNAEIFIIDYAKKASSRSLCLGGEVVEVKLLNIRFCKRLYLLNNIAALISVALILRLIPSRRVREWLSLKNLTFQEIYRSDMFASIAGGDSFSDIYGLRRFLYITLPQILIIVMSKKLILLPQTFGPFRSRLSRIIARFITRNAEAIYTRDCQSIAEIDRLHEGEYSRPKPTFRYDVGFALEPTIPNKISIGGEIDLTSDKLIGFNISGLLYMGGYDRNNMFGLQVDYRDLVREILDLLIDTKGASVLLIPHVFGNDESSESDVIANNAVYQAYGEKYGCRLGLLQGDYDQGEVKHVIGMCGFFVGSRMHACIAATSQCVPAVAIAYSDKFIGVMEAIGHADVVADARELNMGELLARVSQSYDCRFEVLRQLEQSMPQVTRAALHLFSEPNHDSSGIN